MTRALKIIGAFLAFTSIIGGLQVIYNSARPASEGLVGGAIGAVLCAAGITYLWIMRTAK
jgi:hypothetical protein